MLLTPPTLLYFFFVFSVLYTCINLVFFFFLERFQNFILFFFGLVYKLVITYHCSAVCGKNRCNVLQN